VRRGRSEPKPAPSFVAKEKNADKTDGRSAVVVFFPLRFLPFFLPLASLFFYLKALAVMIERVRGFS
jgi:hypothetical protein